MTLNTWLASISDWYQMGRTGSITTLESRLYSAPNSVWGPHLTENQSKAIACWLDGCLRVFEYEKYQDSNKAYQTLQYIAAKLEMTAFSPTTDIEIKDWGLKRLQHITVLRLEFCNQQQDQSIWDKEAHTLIDVHVKLMASISWNEAYNEVSQNNSIRH
ncbi:MULTISPECIES: transcriptional regulator [Aliivibrio]|uniref:Transcriptional regulator n=1 Tax=Aliivibrio finisterrensis TaxID=511998 RepID=A0A4Q5L0A2_9GAMM|nr:MULTISPECIES: transcriptional regulator [Aliivibrio]MDD9177327.1 transcriptional regulator [Aliivibrio sp. A6]RYU54810.1 transcriptional regulator [Aliivibrio finisterrensis]RYU56484.1 transcriptional regulator [Aliivibrio finisterrensis]RYU61605.1 transcriptional regulator [Aliivibrio finisterrensis]RYU66806.1 transcriptional regulator [Aliivibrio finisterrensis]